jgi:XTP/dITP diphosphohydrolase
MRLYVATSNAGKLRDFAYAAEGHLLNGQSIQIEPLPNLAGIAAPPEDAPTFEANARAKALYYAAHAPGELVLADDSGLEVDALDGEPGVRSARYADDHNFDLHSGARTDDRNNALLLDRLMWTSAWASRIARYRCALALARCTGDQAEIVATADGTLEGEILRAPRGTAGFGYDPLFLIPDLNQTMAELDPTTRLRYSHRGRALRTLLQNLP